MDSQVIAELENAATIIMAPPNIVSNEQRHAAEGIFMDFRKSKTPYAMCREVLEKSQNHYVLFEAAEVLKGAVIREWSFLLESDRVSLRQYLLQYIIGRRVPSFVRDRILQVIAIMVKRASVDDGGRERANILQEVENLIVNAEADKKIIGCNIITNLMQEYANTVKSTDVGLPWEIHFRAKKQFEATDLKRIFQFCIYLLSEVVKTDPPYSDTMTELTGHLLTITSNVLTWGYVSPMLPKRLIGIFESVYEADQAPALKLTSNWADIIFNPELLPLMFNIYWKVRDVDQLAHHALICLVQLSSLSGGIVSNDEERTTYLQAYLTSFLRLISNVTIKNKEALGISNISKKLVVSFVNYILKLPDGMRETFLDEMTRLTCMFCDRAAIEEAEGDEDRYFSDAFETMLETWTNVLQEFNVAVDERMCDCATRVFNCYVQSKVAPPDGNRRPCSDDSEEIEDDEDNDRVRYRDQLQTIGMFGRVIPKHSLTILLKLLEARTEKLVLHVQALHGRAMNISEAASLDSLFEDLHWTILIAGHVLCMDSDGETPMIPTEMMQFSIEQCESKEATVEATLKALEAIETKVAMPEDFQHCDAVIKIVFNVMKLCSVEDYAVNLKLGHFMSPELGCSLMWFLKRWCLSYLLPVQNYYQEMSPTLIGSLGKDTEGAQWVVCFVLSKIQSNLFHFQSEPVLLRDTVDLFCDIVCVKQKSSHIVKSNSMRNLITLYENLEPGVLPPNILRGLCKGFVIAGSGLLVPTTMNRYYEMVLTPLQTKFKSLVGQPDFARVCHKERVQKVVIDILECFIGIAKGSQMGTVEILFQFLAPMLSELPAFLQIYNNYQIIVQLILELFGQVAKYMLCYLSPLDSKRLYESTLTTVQTYAKCNSNRLSNETFAEESSFQDLALVLDLLTFILSKDCLDLCVNTNDEEINITASDVSLFGLNFIMPLMTLDLLKYPTLCAQFYRLLVLINDIYPEKICCLPEDLLRTLLQSIELGLTHFGSDIVQTCLDFIQGMATYTFKHKTLDSAFAHTLKPFLKLLMDLTLSHQINSDLMSSASTCIYALMCCYQDEYQMLVQSLIQMQTDPLVAERLAAAFNNLTLNIAMNCERTPKLKFRDNFDKFIANVHGFLLVK